MLYEGIRSLRLDAAGDLLLATDGGEVRQQADLRDVIGKDDRHRMRRLGLSAQKTLYIRELAKHTKKGSVVFEGLPEMDDQAVVEHLTQVKGIGVWTAHMFLIFALRRPDVLPTGDLGIRMAMQKAWNLAELPKPQEMETLAAKWRPWASVASWYLWRSLDNE